MKKDKNTVVKSNVSVSKGFGIAGFILSLLAFVGLFLFGGLAGLIPGILGLIFCIIQSKKGKTSLSKAGFILSIIAIVISLFNLSASIFVWNYLKDTVQSGADQVSQRASNIGK